MARSRRVVMVVGVAAAVLLAGPGAVAAVDEILLRTGERLVGELAEAEFTLDTEQGIYRFTRATAWRIQLGAASGDAVELRNGNRISGLLDQARYTIRVAGGRSVVVSRQDVDNVKLGGMGSTPSGEVADVIVLANGDHVFGDVSATEFDIVLDTGTQRFQADSVWRVVLNTIEGDGLELMRGGRLSGIVNHPRYSIRTTDGQVLTFAREEVAVVQYRLPERPRPAAGAAGSDAAGPGAGASGPQVAALPTPTLPPPLRATVRDIYFGFDRWELTGDARQTLEEFAVALKSFPGFSVLIEGHADERGTPEYNLALGERRAQTAKEYLVNLGIDVGRIDVVSYGEERPLDRGQDELAWALNRRAHFVVKSR